MMKIRKGSLVRTSRAMVMRKRRMMMRMIRKTKMIQIMTPMVRPFNWGISFNLESIKVEDDNFTVMNCGCAPEARLG